MKKVMHILSQNVPPKWDLFSTALKNSVYYQMVRESKAREEKEEEDITKGHTFSYTPMNK